MVLSLDVNGGNPAASPKCEHGDTVLLTTKKQGLNLGRKFYRCPLSGSGQCSYFKWEDEFLSEIQGLNKSVSPGPRTPKSMHPLSQPWNFDESPTTSSQPLKRTHSSADLQNANSGGRTPKRAYTGNLSFPVSASQGSSQGQSNSAHELALGNFWAHTSPTKIALTPSQETLKSSDDNTELSTPGSISHIIPGLEDLLRYVKGLKRKIEVAEKGGVIQAQKIIDLENEVARLKAREQQLEEIITYTK